MLVPEKFTPEVMLGAPRRSVGVPNRDGTLVLYNVSTHDFNEHKTIKELKIMDIETTESCLLSGEDKITEALWVPGETNDVVYLKKGEKGCTLVMVADAANPSKEHYQVAEVEAPIRGMKLKRVDEVVAFAVVGLVGEDGKLFNDEAVEKKSTGRAYDGPNIRIWDAPVKDQRHSIWFSQLEKRHGKWCLAGDLRNLLRDTDLEAPGGVYDVDTPNDHYDICSSGIIFDAFEPAPEGKGPDSWGNMHVYYVPLDAFTATVEFQPRKMSVGAINLSGSCSNVRFSPDGSMVAFLFSPASNYADHRIYMGHLNSAGVFDVFKMVIGGASHLPPDGFEFAGESETLILKTEDCGRLTLQKLNLRPHSKPETIYRNGTVAGFHPLVAGQWNKLLVSSASFVESSLWQVVDVNMVEESKVISSLAKHGARFGLSHKMVSEIWYEGADEAFVHAFIIKPSDFDETKQYPWILMPHGGPEAAWADGWSTRWNMALFAEQGYVLVCPNIAGSTGYGLEFTGRIYGSWGGAPYQDLVNLMQYLERIPYLDMDRATVAGASYGGYMISWMFGQELIKRFRCAIWHDGLYSLPVFMLQTDMLGGTADFKGMPLPWSNFDELQKWNPARPELLANWKNAPPTLMIHSEKDYRCPISEGLAAYRTLKAHRVPSRFLTFSDEGHWVLNPENSIVWHKEVFGWIAKYGRGPGAVEQS